jgi:hypothetical protein
MKKLKLAVLDDIGDILTREELKKVFGGDESASGSFNNIPKVKACIGKLSGDFCTYIDETDRTFRGKCATFYPAYPLHCTDLLT